MGKHGLKALGLMFLVALCLTAFMASSASANWRILGVENASNKEIAIDLDVIGTFIVASLGLEISCPKAEGRELVILAKSAQGQGKVALSECTTRVNGVASPKCNPINQPVIAGGKGKLVLIGTKNLGLVEPTVAGGAFTRIEFGAECAVTETNEVFGKALFECLTEALGAGDCSEELKSHLLKQQARAEDELKFGKRAASVSGIVKASLKSEATEKWSGIV